MDLVRFRFRQRQVGWHCALLVLAAGIILIPFAQPAQAIVGGQKAQPHEAPWMVALIEDEKKKNIADGHRCGGALVGPRTVITAAHCLTTSVESIIEQLSGKEVSDPTKLAVRVAVARTQVLPQGKGQLFEAVTGAVFPRYEQASLQDVRRDIAIIHLKRSLPGPYLKIAPSSQDGSWAVGASVKVFGWGARSVDLEHHSTNLPLQLHFGSVNRLSDSACDDAYGRAYNSKHEICAGPPPGVSHVDACHGDSGGPLVGRNSQGESVLVGIVSFGDSCEDARFPGIFTRVAAFRKWIDSNPKGLPFPKAKKKSPAKKH